jgi:uroporphyrinogen decarboxylase
MIQVMGHRERVLAALSHRQPDRVPIDLGGTRASSIVVEGYERLKSVLGVDLPIELCDRMMRIVKVDEEVLGKLDIDTRAIFPDGPVNNPVVDLGPDRYRDSWGVERIQLPGSYYYEQRKSPLAGEITVSDVTGYPWPDPDDPGLVAGLQDRLGWLRANTDCAVVLTLPAPFVHLSQYLRGFEDWYIDFALHTHVLDALFDAVLEITMYIASRQLEAVGREVDILYCSDDLGTQKGLQVSREHYLRHIKPRHARFFRRVHDLSPAKLMFHSCGSMASIIDDLIEIGVDVLNPVQLAAKGMDPVELKRKYRGRMAFWGATNSQSTLPRGTVFDVNRMVEQRVEQLGEGGGYVLASCHNIQPDVPAENVLAMFRHAREYVPSYLRTSEDGRVAQSFGVHSHRSEHVARPHAAPSQRDPSHTVRESSE